MTRRADFWSHTRAACTAALVQALALSAALAAAPEPPLVAIEVRTLPGPLPRIDYVVPPEVDALQFLSPDPRSHSAFRAPLLRSLDGCARLTPTHLERVLEVNRAACPRWQFEVVPQRLGLYAFYEPAQPVGEGVLLQTRHYAAVAPGLGLRWQFSALPGQRVGTAGRWASTLTLNAAPEPAAFGTAAERAAAARRLSADHYVFMGGGDVLRGEGFRLVSDPAVPAWLVASIAEVRELALARYAAALKTPPAGEATLLVTASATDADGAIFHGDVTAGQMIRLHFTAPAPQPDAKLRDEAARFVAHEMAHLWHVGADTTPVQAWLHEGGADWMAAVLLHEGRQTAPDQLGSRLRSALTGCLMEHGSTPWARIPSRHGRAHAYQCGMLLYALAYRVNRSQPALSPLILVGDLLRSAPVLDQDAFVRAVQASAASADARRTSSAAALLRLFRDPDLALADGVREVLRALDIDYAETPLSALGHSRSNAMFLIGRAACRSFVGIYLRTDHVEFDAANQCDGLPQRARVARIQDVAVPSETSLALRRVAERCASAVRFDLTLEDGTVLTLPCPEPTRRLPSSLPQLTPAALADFIPR